MQEYSFQILVVGSGAAGFAACDRLHLMGARDFALVSEGRDKGTSRNTGSDKQTYYKLTLSGDEPDSYTEMARTIFEGKSADGDLALCEAAGSVPAFLHLAELGVPFPTNVYGEYIGYKTDHDPRSRATSAGPLTSKLMTEALEKAVLSHGTPILEPLQMIRILTDNNRVYGILCLDPDTQELVLLHCSSLILATGGPACLYQDSVYPASQHGSTGLAFQAGIRGRGLTEWQYGMASMRPRWNVSGTYMQVIPTFYSTAQDGSDRREFLSDGFTSRTELPGQVFLKGYQWPFDSRKAMHGSSRIDLMVYRETVLLGRRVFLDYRVNPGRQPLTADELPDEARNYLVKTLPADLFAAPPFERLAYMNRPAVDFYLSKGVDLSAEPLEIAICAQHNNGGLAVDNWWRTNVEGIFCIGEAAGTHGVYRPGGTALNAGQVGALRAARYITEKRLDIEIPKLPKSCLGQLWEVLELLEHTGENQDCTASVAEKYRRRMSASGGAFRSASAIREILADLSELLAHFGERIGGRPSAVFRLYDQLRASQVYLAAMLDYAEHTETSRGSSISRTDQGTLPDLAVHPVPEEFRFLEDNGSLDGFLQEIDPVTLSAVWRPVHPIPDRSADVFENIWREYREHTLIKEP